MDILIAVFLVICSTLVTLAVQKRRSTDNNDRIKESLISKVKPRAKKPEKKGNFGNKKETVKVDDNIYVIIGYGLANCIVIEGDEGIIVIDTMESTEVAREVVEAIREITTKPIVGIILTHFHVDHASGTQAFLDDCKDDIPIYAHDSFSHYYSQVMDVRSPITYKRAVRQFGTEIPEEVKKDAGINLNLKMDGSATVSYIYPTITFNKKMSITLAGIDLDLIHAPGETNDQIIVWYPKKKILFPADNVYQAFPNLYAIRGTMHRDTLQWARAIDIMIKLKPEVMIPQHTRPVYGKDNIMNILVPYRDAIQFVHDQTVRYMNKGLTAQEIADIIQLPPHLIKHPYLIEYYGTVEWSVKAVYHGYIGWFSGRAGDLHPLPKTQEANLYLEVIGGCNKVLEAASKAIKNDNHQWAIQMTDLILDSGNQPEQATQKAKEIRSEALLVLASREVSAPGMNWYFTEDLVMKGLSIVPSKKGRSQRIKAGDIKNLFMMLSVMLDSEATKDTILRTVFEFTDTGRKILVLIRRGIAIVSEDHDEVTEEAPEILVTTTDTAWRQIFAQEKNAVAAYASGELKVKPSLADLSRFMGYFDTK